MDNNELQDMEQMMDLISEKTPEILNGIVKTIYTKEAGKSIGQGVSAMYQELINGGMEKDDAMLMTKEYMYAIRDMALDTNEEQNQQTMSNKNNDNADSSNNNSDETTDNNDSNNNDGNNKRSRKKLFGRN